MRVIKLSLLAIILYCHSAASLALELQGDFVQGGVLVGQLDNGQVVKYNESTLPLNSTGQFIIALDRDHPSKLSFEVVTNGVPEEFNYVIQPREYAIQRIEGVQHRYVQPSISQLERSRREAALVRSARKIKNPSDEFLNGFIWPVTGPITGVFGSQRVYNGVPKRPHYGVDVARPVGTPIIAPAAGLVTLAEPDLYYSGGTVIIDHGHGLSSTFLHLSDLFVQVGDVLQQGDRVAAIGATGRVTGPHLDWRMNWTAAGRDVRLDPQLLVPPMDEVVK